MPVTTREDILAKLLEICQGVPGIATVVRNRGLIDNDKRPAIVLMDGGEAEGLRPPPNGRGGDQVIVRTTKVLRPQIFVLLKTILPTNSSPKNPGTALNEHEIEVTRRILGDTELRALLGSNGALIYTAVETDMQSGAAMAGQMRLDFQITYVFDPRT